MTAYEQLQENLNQAICEMQRQEAKAVRVVDRIAEILKKQAGFPFQAVSYRNPDEPHDKAIFDARGKLQRQNNGNWTITMDIRIDARTSQTPIQLPAPAGDAYLITYIPLELKFADKDAMELAIEGEASSTTNLSGQNDEQQLYAFCKNIQDEIKATIQSVATGEVNPARRIGFYFT